MTSQGDILRLGDRSGHDLDAGHPVPRRHLDRRPCAQQELPAAFSRPPAGSSTIRRRSWTTTRRDLPRGAAAGRRRGQRRRRHRHHQSARDHGGVGPRHRPADPPAPSSGRTGAPPISARALKADGPRAAVRGQDRAGARPLFLRHQARLAARPRARRARARAERGELAFGTIDSFLLWRLTGGAVHATDATNASRTLLFDIHRRAWDDELLELFGVPARCCPQVQRFVRATSASTEAVHLRRRRSPIARHRRRPAGGADRPGLLRARHGQIDLRHRLLRCCSIPARSRSPPSTGC